MKIFDIETDRNGLFEITADVDRAVRESGVKEGTAVVFIPHSTAAVTVISKMDELGFEDIETEISRLVPTRIDFRHQFDTPSDAAGHIKSSLIGVSVTVIISGGKLCMGSSQGIFFFEFDGPRKRRFYVQTAGQ